MPKSNQVLGIIGGGQLGSMLASAAKKLHIKTVILTDDRKAPAKNFCDEIIFSDYEDEKKISEFANKVDIVTFEFENIPFGVLNTISKSKKILPDPKINQIVQNRKKEKTFINDIGIQTTSWAYIKSKEDIIKNKSLLPGLLKTCTLGYDGRGQFLINDLDKIDEKLDFSNEYILEKLVNFKKEISVVLTRYLNGEFSIYEPFENKHKNQILIISKIPADIGRKVFEQSKVSAKLIAEKLNYVGTMCVEFFLDKDDNLLVNEIAPRVHNSGHLTINAFNVSQFENHLRSVCGLERVELKKIKNAEMTNIIGEQILNYRNKNFNKNEFFFDYLKTEIKEKRKMGHITILK